MTSDVVVVGGGIIGGTIAWRLAQAGAAVEVVEAGTWGGEASWAGAGMLAPGGEVHDGGAAALLALDGRARYADFVRELREIGGGRIDYRECGGVELAAGVDERDSLLNRMEAQRRLGVASEWLSPERLRAEVPMLDGRNWEGAAWYPGDAIVSPREIMAALRAACEASGVRVRERTAAVEIGCHTRHVEVRTASGECLSAETAVLAAGAWSSHIKLAGAGQLVESFPVRGHLLRYAMPQGWLGPILRHGHTYLVQRSCGALIAGTTTEHAGFAREIDESSVRGIRERAAALLPELADREPEEVWNGLRPGVGQEDPVAGRLEGTRLWTAYGHYRNGILMAPAAGRRIADEIIASLGTA